MNIIPILIILFAGFKHAFEPDHLLAVSNIVSQRKSTLLAVKDGIFWGLGHSTTIMLVGIVLIILKVAITGEEHTFHYFDVCVGVILILVATYRLVKFFREKKIVIHVHEHTHNGEAHNHLHVHIDKEQKHQHVHAAAYGIGLVHGLAGSGELVAAAMLSYKTPVSIILYLLLFTMSCMMGMFVAAGLFSVPFSKKVMASNLLQVILIFVSSGLCMVYGFYWIYENLKS
ncbi:hypothetical protein A9P82_02135 [Arachidicoccus ginsenosidimutans]|uniref:HoxN/HupN/NixA family nickel/cobalt transporter n=1 Tax=Arachidicoccus sp. BS20 TaxID=1850526 RepID=UPI0007F072F1|nr:hypothetical protein [Arachidicoccus sp. BS20]ANI88212.1 hypothetical protein A9P82_02135 [Arachidicoccus sp. BS20]